MAVSMEKILQGAVKALNPDAVKEPKAPKTSFPRNKSGSNTVKGPKPYKFSRLNINPKNQNDV